LHLPASVPVIGIGAASICVTRRGTTLAVAGRVSITVVVAATAATTAVVTTAIFAAVAVLAAAARSVAVDATIAVIIAVITAVVAVVTATIVAATVTVGVVATVAVVITAPATAPRTTAVIKTITTGATATTGTSFRRTKVFAGSGRARTATASLLDAQSATFNDFTLQTFLGSIRLLTGDHLHEAKATRLLGVRVNHDGAVLDVTVLLEQARQIRLGQTRMNASNEKVRTSVLGTLLVIVKHLTGVDRASLISTVIDAAVGGTAPGTVISDFIARRCAAVTVETRLVVVATVLLLVFRGHYEELKC
jgi:hypothetical protein